MLCCNCDFVLTFYAVKLLVLQMIFSSEKRFTLSRNHFGFCNCFWGLKRIFHPDICADMPNITCFDVLFMLHRISWNIFHPPLNLSKKSELKKLPPFLLQLCLYYLYLKYKTRKPSAKFSRSIIWRVVVTLLKYLK